MKKYAAILLIFICIIIVFHLFQFAGAEPVLNVMICSESEAGSDECYTVYSNGKTKEIHAFDKDQNASFTRVASGGFESTIIDNQVVNTLQDTMLRDETGKTFPPDKEENALMQEMADTIPHDIWDFTIIRVENKLFAFAKLNVNWTSPCELYYFDPETKELILLHQWDAVDLIAVSEP